MDENAKHVENHVGAYNGYNFVAYNLGEDIVIEPTIKKIVGKNLIDGKTDAQRLKAEFKKYFCEGVDSKLRINGYKSHKINMFNVINIDKDGLETILTFCKYNNNSGYQKLELYNCHGQVTEYLKLLNGSQHAFTFKEYQRRDKHLNDKLYDEEVY